MRLNVCRGPVPYPPMHLKRPKRKESGGGPAQGAGRPDAAPHDPPDWRAYDSVAPLYERVHAPAFAIPARHLVELLEVKPGSKVLDVGTGTGAAARVAAEAAGQTGLVAGIDQSFGMVALAHRAGGGPRYAAATAIDLPFRDQSFGFVMANFVIHHFQRYQTALFDMLRVLVRGGRMGVTVWGAGDDKDELSTTWRGVAEEFAEPEVLDDAYNRTVPWEQTFSDKATLKDVLHEAGLRDIWVEVRDFHFTMSREDYITGRDITSVGRFLRQMLDEEMWEIFRRRTREVFAERFPERVNDFRDAVFAVGHKP